MSSLKRMRLRGDSAALLLASSGPPAAGERLLSAPPAMVEPSSGRLLLLWGGPIIIIMALLLLTGVGSLLWPDDIPSPPAGLLLPLPGLSFFMTSAILCLT